MTTSSLAKTDAPTTDASAGAAKGGAARWMVASRLPEYHQLDWRGYLDDDWDEIEIEEMTVSSHPSLDYPYEWVEHLRQMSVFRKQLRQFSERFRACQPCSALG